jgi:hypothetical protein
MANGRWKKIDRGVVGRQPQAEISPMRLEVVIDGMFAVHAKQGVFTALAAVAGVVRAEVELGRAVVEFAPGAGTPAELSELEARLRDVIALAGYAVREIRQLPRSLPLL